MKYIKKTVYAHSKDFYYIFLHFLPTSLSFPVERTCNLFQFFYKNICRYHVLEKIGDSEKEIERGREAGGETGREIGEEKLSLVHTTTTTTMLKNYALFILLMTQSILCKPEKVYGL